MPVAHAEISSQSRKSPSAPRTASTTARSAKLSWLLSGLPANRRCSRAVLAVIGSIWTA